jgi:BTB/POZ domain-containing protein KCTD9
VELSVKQFRRIQLRKCLIVLDRSVLQTIQYVPTWFAITLMVGLLSWLTIWFHDGDLKILSPKDLFTRPVLKVLFENAESIAIVAAVILYFKEAPDRKEQKHYEAWQVIDNAATAKVSTSYARTKALQDLNRDGVLLKGLDVPGADLERIELSGAILWDADLSDANLSNADLRNADLRKADLKRANLCSADLRGANLSCADLREADLSGAMLINADLVGADFSGAKLSDADFSDADLSESDFSNANFSNIWKNFGANLSRANLSGAKFIKADLSGANFSEAILIHTDLSEANLNNADLNNADLKFSNLDKVRNLNRDQVATVQNWETICGEITYGES